MSGQRGWSRPYQEVKMAAKTTKKTSTKKAAPAEAERVPREKVITFRISGDEAALIAKAADRVPLARYSRDAVLAKAAGDVKAR